LIEFSTILHEKRMVSLDFIYFCTRMIQYKKVAFYTLGCKLNFSETSTIARDFENAGYAKVAFEDTPDIYVVNTCSVTENADKKCRQLVKKGLKINPNAFIIIVGCFAQLKPKEISEIPGVDLVLGTSEKFNVLAHIDNLEKNEKAHSIFQPIKNTKEFHPSFSLGDRTRTFLKVQDGCDYFCSFCTIPLARGRSRSADVATTMIQAKQIATTDAKEVVLTGVNIGDFGKDHQETFLDLITELDEIKSIDRFRISSIEPNLLNDDIIEFVAKSKKFVPHFHIPLQSGSDLLLQSMRRRYGTELYRNRIQFIKNLMPDCCIGMDVIVGYPGESEEEFSKTLNFIKEVEPSYLHVFTYSERNNTTAVRMDEVVPQSVRKERSKILRLLSAKLKRAFYERNQDRQEVVLFEGSEDNGLMYGFTSNYVKVKTAFNPMMVNQIAEVKMTTVDRDGLMKVEFSEQRTGLEAFVLQ
jgi:threonylcarbamoyladenosine tRNA methylthiotransferase MtaB